MLSVSCKTESKLNILVVSYNFREHSKYFKEKFYTKGTNRLDSNYNIKKESIVHLYQYNFLVRTELIGTQVICIFNLFFILFTVNKK